MHQVKILHGYRYVTARHVAQMIKTIPKVCSTRPYIDCVVTYNEIEGLCKKFADALHDDTLRDPETFAKRAGDDDD